MNWNRFSIVTIGACFVVAVAASLFLQSDSISDQRLRALEQEVATLRQQLQDHVMSAATIPPVPQRPSNEVSLASPTDADTSELLRQISSLSSTLARLEQTTDEFNRRVPQLAGRAELESEILRQAKRFQADVAEVQRIASQFNVELDERAFTDYNFETPLNKQPGFIEARIRMLQARRILQAAETKYVTDLFERTDNP